MSIQCFSLDSISVSVVDIQVGQILNTNTESETYQNTESETNPNTESKTNPNNKLMMRQAGLFSSV